MVSKKQRVSDHSNIESVGCWRSSNFDYDYVNPTGISGGLMNMWDPSVFQKTNTIVGRYFIATTGQWKGFVGNTTLVNVYGPKAISVKRKLWEELIALKKRV